MNLLRKTKVREPRVTVCVEQDVLRLEISVYDADAVEMAEGKDHLGRVEAGDVLGEVLAAAEVEEELAAAEVVQDEVQLAVRLEGVVEPHDERVLHLLEDGLLHHSSGDLPRLDHLFLAHDLHGEVLVRVLLLHQEHLREAALPQHLQYLEVLQPHRLLRRLDREVRIVVLRIRHQRQRRVRPLEPTLVLLLAVAVAVVQPPLVLRRAMHCASDAVRTVTLVVPDRDGGAILRGPARLGRSVGVEGGPVRSRGVGVGSVDGAADGKPVCCEGLASGSLGRPTRVEMAGSSVHHVVVLGIGMGRRVRLLFSRVENLGAVVDVL
mmetsp:Transcript_24613/g.42359  ORF Transcript_24613/g.42359 Transcript_24613/m.42359 type:complete len:322 (+) Transcript_24613:581-1546(+)